MKKGYTDTLSTKKLIKDQSLLRHEDIRHQIRVLPELKALIPPLLPDELAQLENNILADGCREALLVWETTVRVLEKADDDNPVYILVDGHNRYGICQKNGIDFRVNLKSFPAMEQVRTFMIENQLGRRNLTPEQTAYLRGLRYRDEKGKRGQYDRTDHKGHFVLYGEGDSEESSEIASKAVKTAGRTSTAEKLAKQYSVNEKTIKRDAAFAAGVEKLSSDLKADFLARKLSVSKTVLQELGQRDIADGSINSADALTPSSTHASKSGIDTPTKPAKQTKTSTPKPSAIQTALKKLADQLATTDNPTALLCDEIVYVATQFKTFLLENHQGEGKKKLSGGRAQQGGKRKS